MHLAQTLLTANDVDVFKGIKLLCAVLVVASCAASHEVVTSEYEPHVESLSAWVLTGESAEYTGESEWGWYDYQASAVIGEEVWLHLDEEDGQIVAYLAAPWEGRARFEWDDDKRAYVGGAQVAYQSDTFGGQTTFITELRFEVQRDRGLAPLGDIRFVGTESRYQGDAGETRSVEGRFSYRRDDVAPQFDVRARQLSPWEAVRLEFSEPLRRGDVEAALSVGIASYDEEGPGPDAYVSRIEFKPDCWWSPEDLQSLALGPVTDIENNLSEAVGFALALDQPADFGPVAHKDPDETCEETGNCSDSLPASLRLRSDEPFSRVTLRYFYDAKLPERYAQEDAEFGEDRNLERLRQEYRPNVSIARRGEAPGGYGPSDSDVFGAWNERTIELSEPTTEAIVMVELSDDFPFSNAPERLLDPRLYIASVRAEP